jgi:hypothetical protein
MITLKDIFPSAPSDYRYAWISSFLLALVFAPFIFAFKNSATWLITLPLCIGGLVISLVELRRIDCPDDGPSHLVTFSRENKGLRNYSDLLALDVRPKKRGSKQQLALPLFPNFDDPTPSNSIRIFKDKGGHEVPTIPCDRFSALLIKYLMDNADYATDKGLNACLERFKLMGGNALAVEQFFKDRVLRDIIKSDIRGNLLAQISKGGEKVVRDLLKSAEEAQERAEQEKAL